MLSCNVLFTLVKRRGTLYLLEEHHVWPQESSYAVPLVCIIAVHFKFLEALMMTVKIIKGRVMTATMMAVTGMTVTVMKV